MEWRPAAAAAGSGGGEDEAVDGGVNSPRDTDWTLVHSDSYGAEHRHTTAQPC